VASDLKVLDWGLGLRIFGMASKSRISGRGSYDCAGKGEILRILKDEWICVGWGGMYECM
jgi:hypothetical protein